MVVTLTFAKLDFQTMHFQDKMNLPYTDKKFDPQADKSARAPEYVKQADRTWRK